MWYSTSVFTVRCADLHHQQHLEACLKCKLFGPILNLLNQKFWELGQQSVLQTFHVPLEHRKLWEAPFSSVMSTFLVAGAFAQWDLVMCVCVCVWCTGSSYLGLLLAAVNQLSRPLVWPWPLPPKLHTHTLGGLKSSHVPPQLFSKSSTVTSQVTFIPRVLYSGLFNQDHIICTMLIAMQLRHSFTTTFL